MDGLESNSIYCCGICLCDNGKAIRGQIDSCDHYFCFVCIMEWAKVESRCPMCKRRFFSIRRPPKAGVFASERIVDVPQRDQVYHFSGNATTGPCDPYAQTRCNVCNSDADECLLLLCDLCDCAAHTYCVGLGATVPDGDWFCHDCSILRTEHDKIESDDNGDGPNILATSIVRPKSKINVSSFNAVVRPTSEVSSSNAAVRPTSEIDVSLSNAVEDQNFPENTDVVVEAERNVSIFDIIHEPDNPKFAPACSRQHNPVGESNEPGERNPQTCPNKVTQTAARTLRRCRDVHSYIRTMRENWNSLRHGSLAFSSRSVESRSSGKRNNNVTASSSNCVRLHSSSVQQLATQNGLSHITRQDRQDRCSQDIDKAWKMMDKAKSIRQTAGRKRVHMASTYPPTKGNAPEVVHMSSSVHLLKNHQVGTRDVGDASADKRCKYLSLGKEDVKHTPLKFEKLIQHRVVSKEVFEASYGQKTVDSSASSSLQKVQSSSQSDVYHEKQPRLFRKNPCKASVEDNSFAQNRSARLEQLESSSTNSDVAKKKGVLAEHKTRVDGDAKSEIQSLVKLNLKILSRNRQLGVDTFKEVARLATHTILAACGLGHSRYVVAGSFQMPVCSHSQQFHLHRKSTLMPNSCRECFFVFVKDVVNSTLSNKLSHAKSC